MNWLTWIFSWISNQFYGKRIDPNTLTDIWISNESFTLWSQWDPKEIIISKYFVIFCSKKFSNVLFLPSLICKMLFLQSLFFKFLFLKLLHFSELFTHTFPTVWLPQRTSKTETWRKPSNNWHQKWLTESHKKEAVSFGKVVNMGGCGVNFFNYLNRR